MTTCCGGPQSGWSPDHCGDERLSRPALEMHGLWHTELVGQVESVA
jgi:hypothetical protein